MKFKVGDKVKCVYDNNGTFQDIKKGQIYTIGNVQSDGWIMVKSGTQYYKPERFQKAIFTKSDLKDGDIVTQSDGYQKVVCGRETKLEGLHEKNRIAN